jgi:hypothetical protein
MASKYTQISSLSSYLFVIISVYSEMSNPYIYLY